MEATESEWVRMRRDFESQSAQWAGVCRGLSALPGDVQFVLTEGVLEELSSAFTPKSAASLLPAGAARA
jgi:hypothetical protein